MVMPNSDLWGNTLVEAVRNGSVSQMRLDDMAVRIIASWYQMGQVSSIYYCDRQAGVYLGVQIRTDTWWLSHRTKVSQNLALVCLQT